MDPQDYARLDAWVPMSLKPKYVRGEIVEGAGLFVFLNVGLPMPIGLTLEFAEQIAAELNSTVNQLRIVHRAQKEGN